MIKMAARVGIVGISPSRKKTAGMATTPFK
jgi:hypothetical protein